MISKEALEEFKKIWREEHGEDISDGQAMDEATNLLTLMNAVYRPLKKDWVDEYDIKRALRAEAGAKQPLSELPSSRP